MIGRGCSWWCLRRLLARALGCGDRHPGRWAPYSAYQSLFAKTSKWEIVARSRVLFRLRRYGSFAGKQRCKNKRHALKICLWNKREMKFSSCAKWETKRWLYTNTTQCTLFVCVCLLATQRSISTDDEPGSEDYHFKASLSSFNFKTIKHDFLQMHHDNREFLNMDLRLIKYKNSPVVLPIHHPHGLCKVNDATIRKWNRIPH